MTVNEWKEKPVLIIVNEVINNRTEEAIIALKELAEENVLQKVETAKIVDKSIFNKKCGKCGNDLVQPYNFCRFCGSKLIS